MYLLAVKGEDIPAELLQNNETKIYQLESCEMQEIQLVLERLSQEGNDIEHDIRVQSFGNFEVFVDGRPLRFYREKAKELFAYLVDRHGASVTTRQIAVTLWEDEEYDSKLKNKVTRTVSSLKKSLKDAGIADVLIKSWNHLAVDISKFTCDAYEFEKEKTIAINSFKGEYMSNYSWAEYTNGKYVQMQQQWNEQKK